MLAQMTKVEIHGLKHLLSEVITTLKDAGCLHIEDVASEKEVQGGLIQRYCFTPEEEAKINQLEEQCHKIRSFIANLDVTNLPEAEIKIRMQRLANKSEEKLAATATKIIYQLEEKIRHLVEEKQNIKADLINLQKYAQIWKKINPLVQKFPPLSGYELMVVMVEKSFSDQIVSIENALKKLTKDEIETVQARLNQDTVALALYYNQKYTQAISESLWQNNVNELKAPPAIGKYSHQTTLLIEKEQKRLEEKLASVEKKLAQISKTKLVPLVALLSVMKDKLEEKKVLSQCGSTEFTFLISGWLPQKCLPNLQKLLAEKFADKVVVHEIKLPAHELEEAPVLYQNPKLFQTFEPLMNLFETPRYGGIDPTPLLAFFFPLFFGLILGDMGYALLILAASFLVRRWWGKKSELINIIGKILFLAGLSSFFFGFVYGEFFFNVPHLLGIVRPVHILGIEFPFDREKAIKETLIFTVGVGFAHIILGLILGMVSAVKVKNKRHFSEKAGMLLGLVSLMLLVLVLAHQLPSAIRTASAFGLIMALLLLIYGGGILAVLEIFGLVGNILSYARLMALGLVSVMLAKLANEAGGAIIKQSLILGILVAVIIHAVNLVIHLFTPTVHALRLNFVEFFGKFVTPGGRPYKPFKKGGIAYD